MTDEGFDARRVSFGESVPAVMYHQARPRYPVDAIRFAVGGASGECFEVADVGAGTGILTEQLVDAGHRVFAVEPSEGMARVLADVVGERPRCVVVRGSGECTGLGDGCVDVAVFGQSWHWVEPVAGVAEMARVVRRGGFLSMLWNSWLPDDEVHTRVMQLAGAPNTVSEPRSVPLMGFRSASFGPASSSVVQWVEPALSAQELVQRARTWSWFALADDRVEREAALVEFVEQQHGGTLELTHVTNVFRYQRSEG